MQKVQGRRDQAAQARQVGFAVEATPEALSTMTALVAEMAEPPCSFSLD
jgi:hypothetical protein